MSEISRRKDEHIDIVLSMGSHTRQSSTGFDRVCFEHVALPELDLANVSSTTDFLGYRVHAPLLISSMTGGPSRAAAINRNISEAANAKRVAFAVGSQRVALEGQGEHGFSPELRKNAPDVPILANFGASQLKTWNGADMAQRAIDMIGADALIVHLNPLQEAVQAGGDKDWSNVLSAIESLQHACSFPIVVKEVGFGISGTVARQLCDAGVSIIDVAGAGGTNWAIVEAERAQSNRERAVAQAFGGWGIPTADAIAQVRQTCPETTIIASGGITNGIDCAKAIRVGADLVGTAAGVLKAATHSAEAVAEQLALLIDQLRVTCFCTGSRNLADLRTARASGLPGPISG